MARPPVVRSKTLRFRAFASFILARVVSKPLVSVWCPHENAALMRFASDSTDRRVSDATGLSAGAGAFTTALRTASRLRPRRQVPVGARECKFAGGQAPNHPARSISCFADAATPRSMRSRLRPLACFAGCCRRGDMVRPHCELRNGLQCLASVVERISVISRLFRHAKGVRAKANAPVRLNRERKGKSHGHRIGCASVARGED
jgi:hypothetical protein